MAIEYESGCRGCPECIGCAEGRTKYPVFICDRCGQQYGPEELYDVDDQMLCAECILVDYDTIERKMRYGKFV